MLNVLDKDGVALNNDGCNNDDDDTNEMVLTVAAASRINFSPFQFEVLE